MYHVENQNAMFGHTGSGSHLPELPRGIRGVFCGPGWLVLKAMDMLLQLTGGEASWRYEVRRQIRSGFYGRLYAGILWGMLALGAAVLLLT